MFVVTKDFKFCAAHRLVSHRGKCRHLHGHNYVASVQVKCVHLSESGMVIDFADLSATVGKWIDSNWDHNVVLNPDDPLSKLYRNRHGLWKGCGVDEDLLFTRQPFFMPRSAAGPGLEPTAEEMARVLFQAAASALVNYPSVEVHCVHLEETDSCTAHYAPDDQ